MTKINKSLENLVLLTNYLNYANDCPRQRSVPFGEKDCCGQHMKQCSKYKWKCSICGKTKNLRKKDFRKDKNDNVIR